MKNIPLILAALLFNSAAFAQSPSPAGFATPSPTPACEGAEFRQFDFWLGKWKVTLPQGPQVGTSEITRQAEGCAIREQWTAASGKGGVSINYYDSTDRQWYQDWVGGDGTILHLHGGMKEGAMVLSDESKSSPGAPRNRITFTPMPDGKAKQEWSISKDRGQTWETSFLGVYEKQP
jgi:hypothetical protein